MWSFTSISIESDRTPSKMTTNNGLAPLPPPTILDRFENWSRNFCVGLSSPSFNLLLILMRTVTLCGIWLTGILTKNRSLPIISSRFMVCKDYTCTVFNVLVLNKIIKPEIQGFTSIRNSYSVIKSIY